MVKKRYDVIIVGAGIAGLMLAKLLNNSKLKVLLLEKRNTIQRLKNCRYGTLGETVKKFKLGKYVIKNFSKFGFYGPEMGTCYSYKKKTFQVVDMNKFARSLTLRCDSKTNYNIREIVREKNLIRINNDYEANLVVDCSGDQKIVAHKLGLLKKDTINMFSTSYEMKNCNIPKDRLNEFWFMADLGYTNVGLWFYPYSKDECQIGHTDFYSKKLPLIKNQSKSPGLYIKNVFPYKNWLKNAKIVKTVRKTGPTTTLTAIYDDNFIACGDAAGAGTPIVGEGFRIALEMALSAKQTITKAFKEGGFSKKSLRMHQNNFYKIKKYYFWSNVLRFLILHVFTNTEYDRFADNLKNLSAPQLYSGVKSEFTLNMTLKVIDARIIIGAVKNVFLKLIGTQLNNRIIK